MAVQAYLQTDIDDELAERALRTYLDVLAIGEPIRLRLWDSRGLTTTQLRLMFILGREQGASIGRLAHSMNLSPAAMTGIIDRLVRSRVIRRRADRRDRRLVRIYLTRDGAALLDEMDAAGRAYVNEIIRHLGRARVEAFVDSLDEFLEAARRVQPEDATA